MGKSRLCNPSLESELLNHTSCLVLDLIALFEAERHPESTSNAGWWRLSPTVILDASLIGKIMHLLISLVDADFLSALISLQVCNACFAASKYWLQTCVPNKVYSMWYMIQFTFPSSFIPKPKTWLFQIEWINCAKYMMKSRHCDCLEEHVQMLRAILPDAAFLWTVCTSRNNVDVWCNPHTLGVAGHLLKFT